MTAIFALLGVKALWFLYVWLVSTILSSAISGRKGRGEKLGLAFGLLTTVIGVVVMLFWPAAPDSLWKTEGPIPKTWIQAVKNVPRRIRGLLPGGAKT